MDRQVADASMLDCLNADLYGLSLSECDAIRLQKEFLSKWRHVLRPSDVVRVEEKISDEENHLIDYIAMGKTYENIKITGDGMEVAIEAIERNIDWKEEE